MVSCPESATKPDTLEVIIMSKINSSSSGSFQSNTNSLLFRWLQWHERFNITILPLIFRVLSGREGDEKHVSGQFEAAHLYSVPVKWNISYLWENLKGMIHFTNEVKWSLLPCQTQVFMYYCKNTTVVLTHSDRGSFVCHPCIFTVTVVRVVTTQQTVLWWQRKKI